MRMRKDEGPKVTLILGGRRFERRLSKFVSITEAAALLGRSRRTVYYMIHRGQLTPVSRRGRQMFRLRNVLEVQRPTGEVSHAHEEGARNGARPAGRGA